MVPAIALGIVSLADKLIGLGSELIEDPEKRLEYQRAVLEVTTAFSTKVLETTTVPWVDAAVKLAYALRDVIIPLIRPIGAAAITAFGLYAHSRGLEIEPVIHGTLDAAFPGWMASRHIDKSTLAKEETKRYVASERRKAATFIFPYDDMQG